MPNQQESSTDKTSKSVSPQMKTDGPKSMQGSTPEKTGSSTAQTQGEGSQLEQFVTYVKANWRPVLTELVAAGVTAYLAHGAKDKASKN
jgi:hypothetical protein